MESGTTPTKTMRSDARRNREKLLAAALGLFTEKGAGVSLEAVAREAGVGVGTLYRHFPTREALVEATYLNELEQLTASATELLDDHAPDEALSLWLDRFVDYGVTKRGLASAMQSVIAAGGNPYSESRAKITAALGTLLDAARDAGAIRRDVDAEDVLRAIGGIWAMPDEPEWPVRARTLIGLMMDGLRFGA